MLLRPQNKSEMWVAKLYGACPGTLLPQARMPRLCHAERPCGGVVDSDQLRPKSQQPLPDQNSPPAPPKPYPMSPSTWETFVPCC